MKEKRNGKSESAREREREKMKRKQAIVICLCFLTGILFICFENCCWFSDATETHARFCGYFFSCFFLFFQVHSVFKRSKSVVVVIVAVNCGKPLIAHFLQYRFGFCSFFFWFRILFSRKDSFLSRFCGGKFLYHFFLFFSFFSGLLCGHIYFKWNAHCVHIKMGILFPNRWKIYIQKKNSSVSYLLLFYFFDFFLWI